MSDGYTYTATVSIRGYDGHGGEVLKDERTLEASEDLDAVIEVGNTAITQYKMATGSMVETFPERRKYTTHFIPVMFLVNSYEGESTAARELMDELEQWTLGHFGEYDVDPRIVQQPFTIQKFNTPNHNSDDPETFMTTIDLRDAAGYGAALLLGIDIDAIKAEAKEQA